MQLEVIDFSEKHVNIVTVVWATVWWSQCPSIKVTLDPGVPWSWPSLNTILLQGFRIYPHHLCWPFIQGLCKTLLPQMTRYCSCLSLHWEKQTKACSEPSEFNKGKKKVQDKASLTCHNYALGSTREEWGESKKGMKGWCGGIFWQQDHVPVKNHQEDLASWQAKLGACNRCL